MKEGDAVPQCQTCTACVNGDTYESRACTPTTNRVCSPCTAVCPVGWYIAALCSVTSNLTCTRCVTKCPAGFYMNPGATQCTGTERSDVVAAGCSPCLVPSNCTAGQYLGSECAGTETKINECRACVEQTCPVGEYSGGCGGLQPARCLALTRCPAGQFLDQWSKVRDGVCKTCTNCAAQRLVQVRACGLLEDAACEGELCGETIPCNSTSAGARFCNYVAGVPQPSCGVCPVRAAQCFLGVVYVLR